MSDTPATETQEHFEFSVWDQEKENTYMIGRGGKIALVWINGQLWSAQFGVVDGGTMSFLLQNPTEPLPREKWTWADKSMYQQMEERLQYCQQAARGLFKKRETWWVHIDNIMRFYAAICAQNDMLLERCEAHHPEFEKYRLPEISDDDRALMQTVARVALRSALKSV